MTAVRIEDLPSPPEGRTGWPWTKGSEQVPPVRPDGSPWPSVSVVTPSFNQGQYLEETIRSVLLQGYPNLEYFVMDGASSDESVAIITKYARWLSGWVSQADKGQADAIAAGLERCTGDVWSYINSDDLLMPNTLRTVGEVAGQGDLIAGDCENFGPDMRSALVRNHGLSAHSLVSLTGYSFQQPALWFMRNGVLSCGGIQRDLHYCFDWDLAIRYLHCAPRVIYLDKTIAKFRLHPASKTVSQKEGFDREHEIVISRLAAQRAYLTLHATCKQFLGLRVWWRVMASIEAEHSGLQAALRILVASFEDPKYRWGRMMFGAMRKALLGKQLLASGSTRALSK